MWLKLTLRRPGNLLLALPLLLPAVALAQTPDTTSAWRYYPLQVGNVWEYHGHGMSPGDFRVTITGDTTIGGKRYFVRVNEVLPDWSNPNLRRYTSHVRFDTTTSHLVFPRLGGEFVFYLAWGCELDAPFGGLAACRFGSAPDAEGDSLVTSGGYNQDFELADGSVLYGVTLKHFGQHGGTNFVADIGYVSDELGLEPGGKWLSYAKVGGVEYGSDALVSREPPPEIAAGFATEVYPNPFVGTTTVSYTLPVPSHIRVSVYDLLVREVVRVLDDYRPAGPHEVMVDGTGLRSGVYLLRVEAGGARRSRTVVVLR